jgi:hypothetical protein
MKTIAVIEKNKCSFDRMEEFASPLLYKVLSDEERKELKTKLNDYIWSVIEPYVKFIEVNEEDFLTVVCKEVTSCFPDRQPDDFFYHTEGSYSFPKKFIEFIYCQPLWKDYVAEQPESMNNLGCLFSLKHHIIENNCIVFANKYDLSASSFTVIDSVTKEDIIRIVRRRYFFSAVLIKENSMIKYYYQNPSYLVANIYGLTEKDNIQKLEFGHLKYNLVYYFQQDRSKYINQIATRINGVNRVHGDILVLHEMEEKIYANLSLHEMKRLNVLSYGRLYDRQLKDFENYTMPTIEVNESGQEIEKKTVPMWSRYIVLDRRMIEWNKNKNKCFNCSKEAKNLITCPYCYRLKYCSFKCQKEHAANHREDCFQH